MIGDSGMVRSSIGICSAGWPFIGILAFTALLTAILGWRWATLILWALCLFTVYFFRDPERVIAAGAGIAVSPADGTVIGLEYRRDPFSNEEVQCISIFMSVFNVHVNRSPVAGTVEAIRYIPGKFFNASLDKASNDNERCLWQLRTPEGESWTVVQIAGLIARRIVPYAQMGDSLGRGDRFGMIRFGSRVDLYLPKSYAPAVEKGATVFGGQSVIAEKKS